MFGYECTYQSYGLDTARKDSLINMSFPTSKKEMQSFLGSALFFHDFIPHYASLTAPLHDTTKSSFDWSKASTWSPKYQEAFFKLKDHLRDAQALYHPDFSAPWVLRTDASTHAVGAVLLQLLPSTEADSNSNSNSGQKSTNSSTSKWHPISYVSKKFSDAATRWSTIEQEAFAMYYAVSSLSHLLRGKTFVLETDHANLQWMAQSNVPKIIRWRIFLQSFSFLLRHVPGKENSVADWLSRPPSDLPLQPSLLLSSLSSSTPSAAELVPPDNSSIAPPLSRPEDLFKQVHNGRTGHHGVRRTWNLLNLHFPGHHVPIRVVSDLVEACPICQKERLGMVNKIQSTTRALKAPHLHSSVGIDILTVTPTDKFGNSYLVVLVNLFSKLVFLFPIKNKDAISVATAIFSYISIYGIFDFLVSDPGTEFINETITHLNGWLGITHNVALVDRHQTNGVERSNGSILRYLRALIHEENSMHEWSDVSNLASVTFIMNSTINSETGVSPLVLHFGDRDSLYHAMPVPLSTTTTHSDPQSSLASAADIPTFIQKLSSNIAHHREKAIEHHTALIAERLESNPLSVETTNLYQAGDFVLLQLDPSKPRPSKLTPRFRGPYEVIAHDGNTITARHLSSGKVSQLHSDRVKIFIGSPADARDMADLDYHQHEFDGILNYAGDPRKRSMVDFEIRFVDGDILWLKYSPDLAKNPLFEDFVRAHPALNSLLYTASIAHDRLASLNKTPITEVRPGDKVFVNLRAFNEVRYVSLPLPNLFRTFYLLECVYGQWPSPQASKTKREITITSPLLGKPIVVSHQWISMYGTHFDLPDLSKEATTMQIVLVNDTHTGIIKTLLNRR